MRIVAVLTDVGIGQHYAATRVHLGEFGQIIHDRVDDDPQIARLVVLVRRYIVSIIPLVVYHGRDRGHPTTGPRRVIPFPRLTFATSSFVIERS